MPELDLRFILDRSATTTLQRVFLWAGLGTILLIRPIPTGSTGPEDDVVEVGDLQASLSVEPGGLDRPEPVLRPGTLAATRLGQWALLRMVLPAKTPLIVEHGSVGSIAYVGGDDTTRATALRMAELVRAAGTSFHVVPFERNMGTAQLPKLTIQEMLHALTVAPLASTLPAQMRALVPAVTGIEFRKPQIPHMLIHVRPDTSAAEVERVARVVPEVVTPGWRASIVPDGMKVWRHS